jgi:hypothetical protein
MVDMSQFIAAKSDQLNADDLMDAPRTITVTKVTASPDAAEQPVSIHYEGDEGKPFKPCKTMRRILVGVWGKDASKYVGRSLTLYRDATVAFGGLQVGGIRISHMSDISEDKTVALLVTRGRKAPFKIKPLVMQRQQSSAGPAAGQEDAASRWANGYIAKLADFTTLDALQAFADQKSAKLAELAEARADLHEKVVTALATRTADLKAAGSSFDDDDFSGGASAEGNAPASEATAQSSAGASSTASGETTSNSGPTATSDASPSEVHPDQAAKAADIIAAIEAAAAVMDVTSIVARNNLDIAAMPDELAVKIEIAADKRKRAIEAERAKAGAAEKGELAV